MAGKPRKAVKSETKAEEQEAETVAPESDIKEEFDAETKEEIVEDEIKQEEVEEYENTEEEQAEQNEEVAQDEAENQEVEAENIEEDVEDEYKDVEMEDENKEEEVEEEYNEDEVEGENKEEEVEDEYKDDEMEDENKEEEVEEEYNEDEVEGENKEEEVEDENNEDEVVDENKEEEVEDEYKQDEVEDENKEEVQNEHKEEVVEDENKEEEEVEGDENYIEDEDEEYQTEDEVYEDEEIDQSQETESGESDNEKNVEVEVDDPNFDLEDVLQTKIKLSDETECLIFSRGPRYSESDWPINCHLCNVAHILTSGELKKHINTLTHQEKLTTAPDAETFRTTPLIQPYCKPFNKLNNPLKIFPGEFIEAVTPDFYDRLQKVEEFEFRKPLSKKLLWLLEDEPIHDYNEYAPILGLSYILKFKGPVTNIEYYCLLCMTKCVGEAYQHLVGSTHQMNYIRAHFSNLYKKVKEQLGTFKTDIAQERHVRVIFRKIYRKFEELRGLRQVHIIFYKDYLTGKIQRFKKFQFRKLVHYDEKMLEIPDSEIAEWAEKCKKGEMIIEPDAVSLRKFSRFDSDGDIPNRKRKIAPSWKRDSYSPPRKFTRDETPRVYDTPNNWDRYRRMMGAALDDIDRQYEDYEDVPERHTDYELEWKKYWRRRSKELERDNIDPSYYDFKPEWLDYWADLLKDLHKKDIAKCKYDIKRKLQLPLDKHSPSPIRRRRSRSPQRSRSRPRRGSPSTGNYYRGRKRYTQPPRSYDHHRQRREDETPHNAAPEPLSVLSVLRQLTVLEDQLGSLGPKALEYLSRAVLFEKERNKSADELMREKEFYVFFVTAKEKLKGQLIANVVERAKMKTANNVIRDLDKLLNSFESYMRNNPGRSIFNRNQSGPPTNMGNQMEYMHPPRPAYNPHNMSGGHMGGNMNMHRQIKPTGSMNRSYNTNHSKSRKHDEDDDEIIEAPPPPRNLFNIKDDNGGNNQMESFQRNAYNPPNSNFNSMNEMTPIRNQYPGPSMGPRMGGGNFNQPPSHQFMSGGKGGAWPGGSRGNYGRGGGFKHQQNYQFQGNSSMMNFPRPFRGGYRGHNPHINNSSFLGSGHHSFNN